MTTYKIFKKNPSKLRLLTPLSESNKLKVCKLIDYDDTYIGYNEDEEMFIEISQCPRIYLGMIMSCKNLDTKQTEELGKLVDLQYDESSGYLFVFE